MQKKDTLSRLKAEERKMRQQIIIDAAREVFGQKTYDRASMSEIAKTAGIAKSSIYTYFNSQEELYARIAYIDACEFIEDLQSRIEKNPDAALDTSISYFLDYYIRNTAQWRMITHFALHGNKEMGAVEQLNDIGRRLMDVFESVFTAMGAGPESRLLSHTMFSCLSGILIAFRNYPGRSETERISHMKRIGGIVEAMIRALIKESGVEKQK
ncbi:MAG: TetR/AcrR family transcriptional regulator [Desulfobacterales bacterium]|nr:TetR/AcrR family transcriptional regulator [Desulfobacterales bacterium]